MSVAAESAAGPLTVPPSANLAALLHARAAAHPDAPALIDATGRGVRAYSFAQLDNAVARAATLLHAHGLRPGHRVLIVHPMAADLYIALGAIFRLGAAALFIDPSLGRAQIAAACARLAPHALLATPKAHLLRLTMPALRRIPLDIATGWGAPGALAWRRLWQTPPGTPPVETSPETPALLTLTSGSTGRPKIALRSQGFLQAQHAAIDATLGLGVGDRVVTTLPIFVLSFLASGAATILPAVDLRRPGQVDAPALIEQILQHRATCLAASPALLEQIARAGAAAGQTLPGITRIYSGGGPVFLRLLDAIQTAAPRAAVTAVYGATEAEPMAHLARSAITVADRERMQNGGGLLVGTPIAAVRLRILPDRWGTPLGPFDAATLESQTLPAHQPGEIWVSGDHVLAGYWQGEGDAETKVRVGDRVWHRTGDAGYLDETGRLWLLGRCAARVADAQGVLYPFAVECAAQAFAEVKHAALVAQDGERVLALELYQPLTPARRAALEDALAWAKLARIGVLPRLPVDRRHNAKIDYPALAALLARAKR
ncbi:MAG: AMP-dependent synthetase [Chloroflexi bacterium]|nr:MAG: AMP-dependent synthetase [Chloroflexota bacterium]